MDVGDDALDEIVNLINVDNDTCDNWIMFFLYGTTLFPPPGYLTVIPTETLGVPDNTTDTLDTLDTDNNENNNWEVEIYGSEPVHKQVNSCTYIRTYVCAYVHIN